MYSNFKGFGSTLATRLLCVLVVKWKIFGFGTGCKIMPTYNLVQAITIRFLMFVLMEMETAELSFWAGNR